MYINISTCIQVKQLNPLNLDIGNALCPSTYCSVGISRVCAHIVQKLNFPSPHCYNTQCTAAVADMPSSLSCC